MKNIGIIMAAGRGTRMNPLTLTTPKPLAKISVSESNNPDLIKFDNKTLIEINMSKLEPLVDSFVIVIYYLGEQIKDFIGDQFKGKKVEYIMADGFATGTLDALRTGLYKSNPLNLESSNFIVSNADNLCGEDFYNQLGDNIKSNPDQAVLMATIIEDRDILKTLGVFVVDQESNLICVAEKSTIFVSDLANVGIYYLPNHVKKYISPKRNYQNNTEETITDMFNDYIKQNSIRIIGSKDYNYAISAVEDLNIKN